MFQITRSRGLQLELESERGGPWDFGNSTLTVSSFSGRVGLNSRNSSSSSAALNLPSVQCSESRWCAGAGVSHRSDNVVI